MAYLTKEQYNRRNKNAGRRAIENEEIAVENGMTQEQAEIISALCSRRHELHCGIRSMLYNNCREIKDLIRLNIEIQNTGLDPMPFVPVDESEYMEIDCIDELLEVEQLPDEDDKRDDWFADKESMIWDQWEQLNTDIEHYLADIDKKYHTHFCPTGALRIF